ncbi:MAG TPA: DUF1178 family protein [Allosphingosinicella sp.]|nr:DUF1178 family protein [Allosphingosinicella sp.]
MIIFDLRCEPQGHVFEAWFGSNEDFEDQKARGLVQCPICGGAEVGKAPMAPRLGARGEAEATPEAVKAALSEMAATQRRMLESSEHVGDRFPDEARAIHLGEAEARVIHGRATLADADSLRDEGITIAPLPFPVPDPGEEN